MNSKIGKVVILGVSSFSGAWAARHFLDMGYDVLGVGRRMVQSSFFLPFEDSPNIDKMKLLQADINKDQNRIFSSLTEFKPDFVINFVAQGMVAESWDNPIDWFQTNVISMVALLDNLRHLPSLQKYIHFTTPEVYGSTDGWIKETTIFHPSTPYATSRACFDQHLMTYFNAYKFPVIFTRASNVFGPGQQLYRIVPRTIMAAITEKKLELHGGGSSVRNFVDIRDVASGLELLCRSGKIGGTYHISGHELISIKSLVEKIAKNYSLSLNDICVVGEERLGKDEAYALDSSLIRDSLGWNEKFTNHETLTATYEWVANNLDELKKLPFNYEHRS